MSLSSIDRAQSLLEELRGRSITLRPTPKGNIRYRPKSAVSPEDVRRIKEHKKDLLDIFRLGRSIELSPQSRSLCVNGARRLCGLVWWPASQERSSALSRYTIRLLESGTTYRPRGLLHGRKPKRSSVRICTGQAREGSSPKPSLRRYGLRGELRTKASLTA